MLHMRLDNIVQRIVRQELIHKRGRDNELMHIHFDLRMSYHIGGFDYNQSRGLHLLYHMRQGGTYVDVFSGVTTSPFAGIDKVTEWKHECSHDSCWRDITIFSRLGFEMADNIKEDIKIKEDIQRDDSLVVAPKDMHQWSSFGGFDNLFQWVSGKVTTDPTDQYKYRKLVELTPKEAKL